MCKLYLNKTMTKKEKTINEHQHQAHIAIELLGKDFKEAIIKVLHWTIMNTLETY